MKRESLIVFVLLIAILSIFSCQKEDSTSLTNGPSKLGVKIEALNPSYSLPVSNTKSAMAGTSMIAWDTARMVVSKIDFEAELKSMITHHDSVEISYKWNGPVLTDLMDTSVSFGNFILQPGFYDEIEIKVSGNHIDANGQPVFYLHGMYTNDVTNIPVMVKVFQNIAFKTEKDSVEVTDEAVDFTGYIQLFLDELMADIDPSDLDNAILTDGAIVISAEKNRSVYNTFLHNLFSDHHSHFHFGHDFDHCDEDHYHYNENDDHDDDDHDDDKQGTINISENS